MLDITTDLLPCTDLPQGKVVAVDGSFLYYHYLVDGFDDRGWGCGYRTLQSMCSWLVNYFAAEGDAQRGTPALIPSIKAIQEMMRDKGGKDDRFVGSREWLGANEIGWIINWIFDVDCRILHVKSGSEARELSFLQTLMHHFSTERSPIMCGGTSDNFSRAILGVCLDESNPRNSRVLVLDPHLVHAKLDMSKEAGVSLAEHVRKLDRTGYFAWKTLDHFSSHSMYNFCCPVVSTLHVDKQHTGSASAAAATTPAASGDLHGIVVESEGHDSSSSSSNDRFGGIQIVSSGYDGGEAESGGFGGIQVVEEGYG